MAITNTTTTAATTATTPRTTTDGTTTTLLRLVTAVVCACALADVAPASARAHSGVPSSVIKSTAKFGLVANTTSTPQAFASTALLSFDTRGEYAYTLGEVFWQYRAQGLVNPRSWSVDPGDVMRLVAEDTAVSILCNGSILNITGCSLQHRQLPTGAVTETHPLQFDAYNDAVGTMAVSTASGDPRLLATVSPRYSTSPAFRVVEFDLTGAQLRTWVIPTDPRGSVSPFAEVTVVANSFLAWGKAKQPQLSNDVVYTSTVFVADLSHPGNASVIQLQPPSVDPTWGLLGPGPQVGLQAPDTSVFYTATCRGADSVAKCRDPKSPGLLIQYNLSSQQVVATRELPPFASDNTSTVSLGQAVVSDTHAFVIADVLALNILQGDAVTVFRILLPDVQDDGVEFERATVSCKLYNLENRPVALQSSIYFNCIGATPADSKIVEVQFGDVTLLRAARPRRHDVP